MRGRADCLGQPLGTKPTPTYCRSSELRLCSSTGLPAAAGEAQALLRAPARPRRGLEAALRAVPGFRQSPDVRSPLGVALSPSSQPQQLSQGRSASGTSWSRRAPPKAVPAGSGVLQPPGRTQGAQFARGSERGGRRAAPGEGSSKPAARSQPCHSGHYFEAGFAAQPAFARARTAPWQDTNQTHQGRKTPHAALRPLALSHAESVCFSSVAGTHSPRRGVCGRR